MLELVTCLFVAVVVEDDKARTACPLVDRADELCHLLHPLNGACNTGACVTSVPDLLSQG